MMRNSMIRPVLAAVAGALVMAAVLSVTGRSEAEPVTAVAAAPLAHMVFFTLANKSEANAQKLVDACHQYLDGHEGTVYFSVGTRAEEFDREVNATDFDVALHLVFEDKAAHDTYQEHPRHLEFIEKNKDLWSTVRVYDSYVAGSSGR